MDQAAAGLGGGGSGKREQLENSLRELQQDIGRLSEKLSQPNVSLLSQSASIPQPPPAPMSSTPVAQTPPPAGASHEQQQLQQHHEQQTSSPSQLSFSERSTSLSRDIISTILEKSPASAQFALPDSSFAPPPPTPSSPYPYPYPASSPAATTPVHSPTRSNLTLPSSPGSISEHASTPKIQRVLSEISNQRDRSIAKVKSLQKENISLRGRLHEMERYKEMCEALERERESLALSLQSSERIRKQQKELIKLLQTNSGRVVEPGAAGSSSGSGVAANNNSDPSSPSLLDTNNLSALMSVGNGDSFSFIDITNTASVSNSFASIAAPAVHKKDLLLYVDRRDDPRFSYLSWTTCSRTITQLSADSHLALKFDAGCASEDDYGSNDCSFAWGSEVSGSIDAALGHDLNEGSTFAVDMKIDTFLSWSFSCAACGSNCTTTVPVVNQDVNFAMPPCPITAAGIAQTFDEVLPADSPLKGVKVAASGTISVTDETGAGVISMDLTATVQ